MILHKYRHSGMTKNRGLEPESVRHEPLLWLGQSYHASDETARNLATRH